MTLAKDPYGWLEELESKKVVKWISKENKRTRKFLKETAEKLRPRIEKYYSLPYLIDAKTTEKGYYLLLRDKDQFKIKLIYRTGEVKELVNSKSLGENIVIKYIFASKSGDRLAYSYSISGSDEGIVDIIDPETLELIDRLKGVIFDLVWIDKDKYYYAKFYRKEKTPDGIEPPTDRIFLRENGKDEMVFGEGVQTSYFISIKPSTNYEKALLTISYGWTRSTIYGGDLANPSSWSKIYGNGDFIASPIDYVDDKYFILSFEDEGYGKIISLNEYGEKKIIVEEINYPLINAVIVNGKILSNYLINASSKIKIYNLNGEILSTIDFDEPGTVSCLYSIGSEAIFKYESFSTPYKLYSMINGGLKVIDSCEIQDNYIVDEAWTKSKDGTRIHMFIFKRKDVEMNKVLIYGYGGFSISLTPKYTPYIMPFIEDGGTYVVTNIRGGSEFGEKWHRMGMREHKQNVFDDFIACIEYFKNRGAKVVAIGRSNGGLLVAAVLTQRPELLDGAIIGYPVIDMLRYHKYYIGKAWIPEYGNPENPEDRRFLIKYSPYHNIRKAKYPPILIYTGLHDDRVHPAHAFKFTVKLEEVKAPVYLRVETESGHAGATPQTKINEEADILAFIYRVLDLS